MKKITVFFAILYLEPYSKICTNLFISLGESLQQQASDLAGSGIYPQVGVNIEFKTKYFTPYNEISIGKFNSGMTYEEYLGIQIGMDIYLIRPSLTLGFGVQSVNGKYLILNTERFNYTRETYFPARIGIKIDLLSKVYGEWEGKIPINDSPGFPMWRLKFGFQIFK